MATLDRSDVQVLLLEMQPAVVASVRTPGPAAIRKAAASVWRLSQALDLPVLASVVPLGDAPAELIAELTPLHPEPRTTITPFGDAAQRERLEAAGRKVLAIGGVSSEIAVLNTVLDALREGYQVHVLLDCCGGLSERTDAAALRRMELAGAVPSSVSSFFTTMIDDIASTDGGAVMGALAELWSWDGEGETSMSAKTQAAALFKDLQAAWKAGDAARFADLFTPEARFVAFDGAVLEGREAITAYHAGPFANHLAGTELTLDAPEVRAVSPEILLASSQGGITRDGRSQNDLTGLSAQTFVMVRVSDRLRIEAFQNTRVRPIDGPVTANIWKDFDRAWSSRNLT